jgi:hypothetical protein
VLVASLAVAAMWWGPGPCQDPVVKVVPIRGPAIGAAWTDLCVLEVEPGAWLWKDLCSVVVHEVGHLRGLGHSGDRRSVMYPRIVRTATACKGRRPARYPAGTLIRL